MRVLKLPAWAVAAVLISGVAMARAEESAFTLEYRRVRPSGEEVQFAVDAGGRVTGTVRPVGASGAGAPVSLDELLPGTPSLPELLRTAGFWAGAPAAEPAADGAVRIQVQAGSERRTASGTEAELAPGKPLAQWAAACEVFGGAGLALAKGWRARGDALAAAGKAAEAVAAYVDGIARVPRVFSVRGPNPGTMIEHFRKNAAPDQLPAQIRLVLDSEIGSVEQMLRRGELERCAPDDRLWPDVAHPLWPWDEKAPPADWEWERLSPREEPNRGVRFGRPKSWLSASPGGKVDWAAALGLGAPLGTLRVAGAADGPVLDLELGWGESNQDAGWAERLEQHVAMSGARLVRTVQYRLRARRLIDVLARRGGEVERWVVVQSGKTVALARLAGPLALLPAAAPDLARVLASLEPQPLATNCAAESIREVALAADRTVRVEVPQDWSEQAVAGAPLHSAFVDLKMPGDAADLRLALRALGETRLFDVAAFWKSITPPGKDVAACELPASSEPLGRVWSLGCGWADVRLLRVKFGEQTLPVVAFWLIGAERTVGGAVVCGRDDAATIARARALAERVAGSATAE